MAQITGANLPIMVGVTPNLLMICDAPDPAKLIQRIKMASLFGGAELNTFDNPYSGVPQLEFDSRMDNMYGPISCPIGGTRVSISPACSIGDSCACPLVGSLQIFQSLAPFILHALPLCHEKTNTHARTHAGTHTRAHAHMHACTPTHTHSHTHSLARSLSRSSLGCTHARTHACLHTRKHACTHASMLARWALFENPDAFSRIWENTWWRAFGGRNVVSLGGRHLASTCISVQTEDS